MRRIQYRSAVTRPTPAVIGRITNGGLSMTSSESLESIRAGVAAPNGELVGDGSGEGDASGDGVGTAAWRVKVAQGLGPTLAEGLWRPGGPAGDGLTLHG